MPSYKLTYFNGRGRAEVARMLFAMSDTKFEDKRIEFSDWPNVKPETPQGSLPVLEIDGKVQLTQSMAVFRYLAREFKMYGKTNLEMAAVDMMMDTVIDMFDPFVTANFTKDEAEKARLQEKLEKETIPKCLGYLEAIIKYSGKNGFAVGEELTVGDLLLNVYIEHVKFQDKLDKFPLLKANREKILALPKMKAYLEKRPKTDF